MPFIRQIEPDEAQGEIRAVYEEILQHGSGRVPPVLKIAGLNAPALRALRNLNNSVSFGGSTLGRRGEEIIATAVSVWNGCPY